MPTPRTLLAMLDRVTTPEIAFAETLSITTRQHYERVRTIFEDENIVGAGIARKVTGDQRTDDLGLVFYVREKIPTADLRPDHLLPPVMAASNGRAVFTDVVEIGDIAPRKTLKGHPFKAASALATRISQPGRWEPSCVRSARGSC